MYQTKNILHVSLWDYAYRWWLKAQYKYAQSRKTKKKKKTTKQIHTEIHILNGQAACV